MRRKRFRIICYSDGDNFFYDTRIKTWFGWISFTVLYKTYILHVLSDPLGQKSLAYERIYQYCKAAGYKKEDTVITETSESKRIEWRLVLQKMTCQPSVILP